MKNYTQLLGLIGLFLLVALPSKADVDVTFENGNLEAVQRRAAAEGKLYLVDFVAKWCMPCKWMDETTFSDPQVTNYLSEHYIPTKVDIDNFDGFNYKNQYQVEVLPTILIFNSKGEIVGRYEESMAPSKMLAMLESHNSPENREKIIMQQTTSDELEEVAIAEAPIYNIEETFEALTDEEIPVVPALEENSDEEIPLINSSLFKMSASPANRSGYAVQVGVFADYGNILIESAKFQSKYNQEVIVQVTFLNDKQVFKLLLGDFSFIEEAHNLRRLIESEGGEAITKDLSKI